MCLRGLKLSSNTLLGACYNQSMLQKKIIIGNWKMNPKNSTLAKNNFISIKKGASLYKNTEVSIATPAIFIKELSKLVSSALSVSAQNVADEIEGAHTGEISTGMLADAKTKHVIIGHSERRALGETNEQINKKIKLIVYKKYFCLILIYHFIIKKIAMLKTSPLL